MPNRFGSLWREPLLHFLLIGAALFVYYDFAADDGEAPPKRIQVTGGQIELLAANFERTWSRPPTEAELDGLIESHIRDEVLYREALAMGLDRDDPMVRRRMRSKLEFMLDDLSPDQAEDTELAAYLAENAERYRIEARTSFQQVYLSSDDRPDLQADAESLLKRLRDGSARSTDGDSSLLPPAISLANESEIARTFGAEFGDALNNLDPGRWEGPIYSAFGAHLVNIEQRIEARSADLSEVRDRVLRDYLGERRRQQRDLTYRKLLEAYEVTIESGPAESASEQ